MFPNLMFSCVRPATGNLLICVGYDVRTAQCAEIIRKCHKRPEIQTAKSWLDENGIDEKQYYYRQRRISNLAVKTTNKSLPATRPTLGSEPMPGPLTILSHQFTSYTSQSHKYAL